VGDQSLAVEVREATGKGVARKLRAKGLVPAVLYGQGRAPVSLSLDPIVLDKVLRSSHAGLNTLIDLEGAVTGKTVLVKDLQRDPVRGAMLHADLYEVDIDQTITVSVPVHLNGIPHGVTMGGLLDHALREIEVECLPGAIPDSVDIDVSGLDQGDSVHVRDLELPSGVELRTDPELSVVSVVAPTVEEEPVVEEGVEDLAAAEGAPEGEAPEGEEPSES